MNFWQDKLQGVRETTGLYSGSTAKISGAAPVAGLGNKKYTIQDYFALPDDCRVELIDGVFYDLATPSFAHQTLIKDFAYQLESFVRKNHGRCRVCPSPIDVQLDNDDDTILQPNLIVVCDRDKIRRHVHGAPDLVVEIESPSTRKRDRRLKHYICQCRRTGILDRRSGSEESSGL